MLLPPRTSFLCLQKKHHIYLSVVMAPRLTGTSSSYLCLLTSERRDIFGGIPSSSVAPLGPDPSFLLFREFSLEEVGGSILPSASSKNWNKMKEIEKEKKKKRYFSVLPKQN